MQVQNKLQLALPSLPQIVQAQGVQVAKSSSNFLMLVASPLEKGDKTQTDLTDHPSPTCRTRSAGSGVGVAAGVRRAVRDAHLARPGQAG